MPAPFDYTVQRPDIMGAIGAYEAGRDRNRQMVQQNKQDMFAQYLPQALKGDQTAIDQASQFATPDQQIQLSKIGPERMRQALEQGQAIAEIIGSVPDGDAQGFEAAKQRAAAMGIPMDAMAGLTIADLPRLKQQSGQTLKELQIAAARIGIKATEANIRQSDAAVRASDALANFRTSGGAGGGRPGGRPMSSGVQSKEDEDIADIQSIQSVNTQIDQVLGDIESGSLELGPINNLLSRGQNLAGLSTPGSRNFAVLEATLEKLRNDSLRLNKGVQTEGDAVRAWNEITKYITDPKVVAEQLTRVKNLNAIASRQRLQRLNIRRQRNGYDAFNPAELEMGGGLQAVAPPQQTGGIEPGTVEDGYVFRGGDPADPANWAEVQ